MYFVGPPVALSACVEVLSESRNPPMPASFGIFHHAAVAFSDGLPSFSFKLIALFGV